MKFQLSKYIKESFSSSKLYQLAELAPYLNGSRYSINGRAKSIIEILGEIGEMFPSDNSIEIPIKAKNLIKEKIFNNPKVKITNLLYLLSNYSYIKTSRLYNLNDSDFYEYSYNEIKQKGFNNIWLEIYQKNRSENPRSISGRITSIWIVDDKIVGIGTDDTLDTVVKSEAIYDFEDYEKQVEIRSHFYKVKSQMTWKYDWIYNAKNLFWPFLDLKIKKLGQPLSERSNLQKYTKWGKVPSESRLILIYIPNESWVFPLTIRRQENASLEFKGEKLRNMGLSRDAYLDRMSSMDQKTYDHNDHYNRYFKDINHEQYLKILRSSKNTIFLRSLQPDFDIIYNRYNHYIETTLSPDFNIASIDKKTHDKILSYMQKLIKAIHNYNYKSNSAYPTSSSIDASKKEIIEFVKILKEILPK